MRPDLKKSICQSVIWVTLWPFLLFSVLASGVMPSRADNGTLIFIICSGRGMTELVVDRDTLEPASKAPAVNEDPCPWALARVAVDLVAFPYALSFDFRFTVVRHVVNPVSRLVTHAVGLPPSTGPPAFLI